MAKSSRAVLRFCCNSFKMLAASSSNFSPPMDSNIFSNCTLSCCTLFIKIHACKCTKRNNSPCHKRSENFIIFNSPSNRPISLISVFAKLLEKLMFNRLIPFIYKNRILTENQNGFRKGRCIETAVQSLQ